VLDVNEKKGVHELELDRPVHKPYHSTMKFNDTKIGLSRTMSALAHPMRRAILERVMRRETRVSDLAEPFAVSLNAVSKHVRVLERARLVRRRRVWREHLVSFNPAPLEDVAAWVAKCRTFWNRKLDALEQLLKEEDAAAGKSGRPSPTQQPGKPK
jgi:DNA-binding transcriptional ArsR family regulator